MESPEARSDHTPFNQTLLLRSVDTAPVEKSQLEPGRVGIPVSHARFMLMPIGRVYVDIFGVVRNGVLHEVVRDGRVLPAELLLQIDLQVAVVPRTNLVPLLLILLPLFFV